MHLVVVVVAVQVGHHNQQWPTSLFNIPIQFADRKHPIVLTHAPLTCPTPQVPLYINGHDHNQQVVNIPGTKVGAAADRYGICIDKYMYEFDCVHL